MYVIIGCYHSATTIGSLSKISWETGVTIKRFSFSEPQAGKSSCDRMGALMKRRIRDYIDRGNDATNGKEFYKSMVDGSPLNGISVHYSSFEDPTPQTNKPQITGIRSLFDFEFLTNGNIKAWGYYGIYLCI